MSATDGASRSPADITVIVMAYNEAANVAAVVHEIHDVLAASRWSAEVLVVDDGSADGTGAIADGLAAALPGVRVLHHPTNRGIGEVYRTGFEAARGAFVTFLPADGQFAATVVTEFAALMGEADLVLGYLPDQGRRRSFAGKMLSGAERLTYRVLVGRLPRFQGVMMFRRSVLSDVRLSLYGRGWGVLTELIAKAVRRGYRVVSVPTTLRSRMSGTSKVNNLATVWANVKQALMLRRVL
jgi:dolichol-phosphate mannosyltransferase